MKKIMVLVLSVLMMVMLVACGNKSNAATEEPSIVGMPNPWMDGSKEDVAANTGFEIGTPDGASDVYYSYMTDGSMAQVRYTYEGLEWTYRAQSTSELTDISGMYFEWDDEQSSTVAGLDAKFYSYAGTGEADDYSVQVVNWYDASNKTTYSLSVTGNDLDGLDIVGCAEAVFSK